MKSFLSLILSAVAGFTFLLSAPAFPCSLAPGFVSIPAEGDVDVALNGRIQFTLFPSFTLSEPPKLKMNNIEVPLEMTAETRKSWLVTQSTSYNSTFYLLETDLPFKKSTFYTLEFAKEDIDNSGGILPTQIQFVTGDAKDSLAPKLNDPSIVQVISRQGHGSATCDYGGTHNEVTLKLNKAQDESDEHYIYYSIYLSKSGEANVYTIPYTQIGYGVNYFEKRFLLKDNMHTFDFSEEESKKYDLHIFAEDIYGNRSDTWKTSFKSVAKGGAPIDDPISFDPSISTEPEDEEGNSCSFVRNDKPNKSELFFLFLLSFILLVFRSRLHRAS